ncbi:MAG: NAD(+)/NADH kinase [Clostridia bacterium]|nr:NAD(+)/NADH kinase [Clostridia bacterium]
MEFKKVGLLTNYNIAEKAQAAMSVVDELNKYGVEILIPQINQARVEKIRKDLSAIRFLPMDDVYAQAELILTLGGDGTILEVARRTAVKGTPILGLNLGRLGYMAEIELGDLSKLELLFTDKAWIETRSMLKAEILDRRNPEKVKLTAFALNDAVIQNIGTAHIINLEMSENGTFLTTYRGDGLIVSTPTGSTAYSLSAGGPVIDPRLDCLCITPICPHSLNVRPILFPDSSVIEVKNIEDRSKALNLTLDGRLNLELYFGDIVRITKSNMQTRLVRLSSQSFYDRLRQKMSST